MSTDGELYLGDEGKSFVRTEMHFKDHNAYVNFSDHPELDDAINPNDEHIYEVLTTGNTDPSGLMPVTPEVVYNKITEYSAAHPSKNIEINVQKFNGLTADYYSLVGHTQASSSITDFDTASTNIANRQIKNMFNNALGEGIIINYNQDTNFLRLSTVPFKVSLSGGVDGYAILNYLKDFDIFVKVLPDKHIHQNYVDKMTDLQNQINNINAMDPNNYYNKDQMDGKLEDVAGTISPVEGRPIVINNGILNAPAASANGLHHFVTLNFTESITGQITTDFSNTEYTIPLNASPIVSREPTKNKALLMNDDLILPGCALEATRLNHIITLRLTGEASGSVEIDTEQNTANLRVSLESKPASEGGNNLTIDDINITVPGINSNGKIDDQFLPSSIAGGLSFGGYFNPTSGLPSSYSDNQYFIANNSGTLSALNESFLTGDWLVRVNGNWYFQKSGGVTSINGQTGDVTIDASGGSIVVEDKAGITYRGINTLRFGTGLNATSSTTGIVDITGGSPCSIQKFGNGSDTEYVISHYLASYNITVDFFDSTTNERCDLNYTKPTNNTIKVTSNQVIGSNAITAIITLKK